MSKSLLSIALLLFPALGPTLPARAALAETPRLPVYASGKNLVRPMAERVSLPGNRSSSNQTPADRTIATLLASDAPRDPHTPQQWSFLEPAQYKGASALFAARDHNLANSPVIVAVVDSGLMLDHEDLEILPGYDFITENQVANDGDGRDNDPTDPGDWVTRSDLTNGLVSANCLVARSKWHGTAVSGIIGAISDNQKGITGGAPSVLLLPVRVTGKCGGYITDLIDGIRWAAGLPVTGVPLNSTPARVINLSVGFPGACSASLQHAIDEAVDAGAIIAVAATNSAASLDQTPQSPASCANVLTAGALLRNGSLAPYSAFGSAVSLLAPGGSANDGIITTENTSETSPAAPSGYGYHFGTSMAAAHLSAALATLLSIDPTLGNHDLQRLLLQSTGSADAVAGCLQNTCGAGTLNVQRAVEMLLDPTTGEPPAENISPPVAQSTINQPQTAAASNPPLSQTDTDGGGLLGFEIMLLGAIFGRRRQTRQRS